MWRNYGVPRGDSRRISDLSDSLICHLSQCQLLYLAARKVMKMMMRCLLQVQIQLKGTSSPYYLSGETQQ
jgi:hypothetical protein